MVGVHRYAKLRWLGGKPQTVQMYGKAKQQRQRLFCVSPKDITLTVNGVHPSSLQYY